MSKNFENVFRQIMESPLPGVLEPSVKPDVKPDISPVKTPSPRPSNPFSPQPGKREKTKPKAGSGTATVAGKILNALQRHYNG